MTDDFTPEQAAKLAEFDAAPTPPEIMRERVAHALWEAHVIDVDAPVPVEWPNVSDVERWRSLADTAMAVFGAAA